MKKRKLRLSKFKYLLISSKLYDLEYDVKLKNGKIYKEYNNIDSLNKSFVINDGWVIVKKEDYPYLSKAIKRSEYYDNSKLLIKEESDYKKVRIKDKFIYEFLYMIYKMIK